MPSFSKSSMLHLITCHKDLQTLFFEVIKTYDCTVTCGFRNKADQEKAFDAGTSQLHFPFGKHNRNPSYAVDVVPYPVDWNDLERFKEMSVVVKSTINNLKEGRKIASNIAWGGDWATFKDYPHWEIKEWTITGNRSYRQLNGWKG